MLLAGLLILATSRELQAAPGDLKWQVSVGGCVIGAPAMAANGDLIVASCDGVHAVTSNGANRWSFTTPVTPKGVAVAQDGTIYVGADKLYAINADGTERWELPVNVVDPYGYQIVLNSPAIGPDGVVYVVPNPKGPIHAVNPDGTLRWKTTGNFSDAPVVGVDGSVYAYSETGLVARLNPDGTERMNFQIIPQSGLAEADDGTLLVSFYGGSAGFGVRALSPDGSVQWNFVCDSPAAVPVVGSDGSVYCALNSGRAIRLSSGGEVIWDCQIQESNATHIIPEAQAVTADGTLYVAIAKKLYAVNADGVTLRFNGGSNDLAAPLIGSDGTIYIGGASGVLSALEGNGSGMAASQWPMNRRDARHSASIAGAVKAPSIPTNITATITNYADKVLVTWAGSPEATHYLIQRGPTASPDQAITVGEISGANSFEDRSATPNVLYYYFVRSRNAAGTSACSDSAQGERRAANAGEPCWIFPTAGAICGSPAVDSNGIAYFGSTDGQMHAVDGNGQPRWSFVFGGVNCSSPVVGGDGSVYFTAELGKAPWGPTNAVVALDATGHLRWRALAQVGLPLSMPALGADQTVYATTGTNLCAIDAQGAVRWAFSNGHHFNTPAIGADGTLYTGGNAWMHAIAPNGALLWQGSNSDSYLDSPIIGYSGVLYYAGGSFHACNADGTPQWTFAASIGGCSFSCVDSEGNVYCQGDSTVYSCLADGTNMKNGMIPTSHANLVGNTVRDADGTRYGSVYDGFNGTRTIFALSSNGSLRWRYDAYGITFGSPTLSDGKLLYVPGSDGRVYAFQTSAGLDTSVWPHPYHDPQHTSRATVAPPIPATPAASATIKTRVTGIRVSWNSIPGASSYDVFRANSTNQADAVFLTSVTGQVYFDDITAAPAFSYTYWVSAKNMSGSSPQSAGVTGVRRQAVAGELLYEWSLSASVNMMPAVGSDGTVYVTAGKVLSALRPDGTTRWEYPVSYVGLGSPSLAADGTIYVGAQTISSSPLLALNPDGTERWEFLASDAIFGAPALATNGTIYFTTKSYYDNSRGALYAVSPDGQLLWSTNLGCAADASVAIARDGTLYVVRRDGRIQAFTSDGVQLWNVSAGKSYTGDSLSGAPPNPSCALGDDGTIYFASGALKALHPDGSLSWQYTNASFLCTPVIAPNGSIIASDTSGWVYSVRGGSNLWRVQLGFSSYASACTSDGLIYVPGTAGKLTALDLAGNRVWQTSFSGGANSGLAIAPDGTIYAGGTDGIVHSLFGAGALAATAWPVFQHDVRHSGRDASAAQAPLASGSLTASKGTYNDRVRVSWTSAAGGNVYDVFRNVLNDTSTAERIATNFGGTNVLNDTTATPGTNYYYWVRGINGLGAGPLSVTDSGFRKIALPGEFLGEYKASIKPVSALALSAGGSIFIAYTGVGHLYALAQDLTRRWDFSLGGAYSQSTVSSPVVGEDESVYFWGSNSRFYAVNPDGTQRWIFMAPSPQLLSPAMGLNHTLMIPGGDRTLYAVDTNGVMTWEYRSASNIVTSPVVGADGTVYFACDDSQLYAVGPDGALHWRFRINAAVRYNPAIGPDGTLYFGADDRGLYAVRPDGSRLWAAQLSAPAGAAPIIGPDDTIYVPAGGSLCAVWPDGTAKWKYWPDFYDLKGPAAAGADGLVYVGTQNGQLHAVNADGLKIWAHNAASNVSAGILEAPLLAENRIIYVPTTAGSLQAVSVSAGSPRCNWPQSRRDSQKTAQASSAITITGDPLNVNLVAGEFTTLRVNLAPPGRTVVRLDLMSGTNVVATASNGVLAVTWNAVPAGTNRLWLCVTDDRGWSVASAVAPIIVSPPPRLTSSAEGGARQLGFDAVSGRAYAIERSLDLEHWEPAAQEINGTGTRIDWTLAPGGTPREFYRVKVLPATSTATPNQTNQ